MDLLGVASITDSGRMDSRENRPDFMTNVGMAIRTLDLVVGDMILVHELGSIFGTQ
jgi:hypothetical protein